ncbi:MAG: CHASE4 domain-containing protein [Sphingorhabdus sp.]
MSAGTTIWARLRNPKHLSAKLAFYLALTGVIGFLAIILFTWMIISQRFGALEQREVQANISRLESLLENQKHSTKSNALDWATWSDAYDYIADGNQDFVDDNLNAESMFNLGVNSLSYVRFDGSLNNSRYIDFASQSEDPVKTAALRAYVGSPLVIARALREAKFQTYARFGDKLVVLAFAHVLNSDGAGPVRGFAVLGREIDPQNITEQLQQRSTYDFHTISRPSHVEFLRRTTRVAVSVADIANRPLATLRFTIKRDIDGVGDNLLIIVGLGIAGLLLVMVAILNWLLRYIVVRPLVRIEDHVRKIGNTKQLAFLPPNERRDEIGTLQGGFNIMAEQLMQLRCELEAQSFELGKNQSAIGVMHNVRNALSPVFTILSRMHERLHFAGQENVKQAIAEMGQDQLVFDRRKKLATFLAAGLEQYEQQLGACRTQAREAGRSLSSALEAIEHVQAEDRASPEITDCVISAVIASSLVTVRHANGTRIEVEQLGDDPAHVARTSRVLLSQIIANLLTNATEAIAASGREDGKIVIAQSIIDGLHGPMLRVSFADNGEGFDPANVPRLFERGYSTRIGKLGGLGLHWCANTLNAMGGTLTMESKGLGHGATAALTLPLTPAARTHMAHAIDATRWEAQCSPPGCNPLGC